MCSRHVEPGAGSPDALEGYEPVRKSYVVTLDGKWEKHRIRTTLPAWGPRDARNLAEDIYPEHVAVKVEEAA